MIKRYFLMSSLLAALIYFPSYSFSQTIPTVPCDTCSQISELNSTADSIENTLEKLLTLMTTVLFGEVYDLGNTMTAFTAVPAVQNNAYSDEQALLHAIEKTYQGNTEENKTLENNYTTIFNDYLLSQNKVFDSSNASISSLYLNPSSNNPYSEDQRLAAQRYIMLVSGAAMSTARMPSSEWLTINSDNSEKDKDKIRQNVSTYYTYSAMQSAIADNLAYIYGLNTGQTIDGSLDNYSNSMISESGLINYIASQKAENETWYNNLKNMGILSLLREQTILLGGGFLMLTRIEEDLRRLLVTNSIQTSLILVAAQSISNSMNKTAQIPTPQLNIV